MSVKDWVCKHACNVVACPEGCKERCLKTTTVIQGSLVLAGGGVSSQRQSSEPKAARAKAETFYIQNSQTCTLIPKRRSAATLAFLLKRSWQQQQPPCLSNRSVHGLSRCGGRSISINISQFRSL